jgi:hypothetical protein
MTIYKNTMSVEVANEILRIDKQIEFLLDTNRKLNFLYWEDVSALVERLKQIKLNIYDTWI